MTTYTITSTAELITALSNPDIDPGDILELSDGIYTSDFTATIAGTYAAPIIIRPINPGKVTLDGAFTFSNHIWMYDIDITDRRTDRYYLTTGVTATGQGNHIYGCFVSQQHSDGINWFGSEGVNEGEMCENVICLNGDIFPDESWHGHDLYSHNNLGGRRLIARNAMYWSMGSYTLQLYSASNKTDDYSIIDNVFIGSVWAGGHFGPNNLIYQNNVNYSNTCSIASGMGSHTCDNILIDGNTFFDLSGFTVGGDPGVLTNLVETDNIVYGGQPASRDGYAFTAKPATWTKLTEFTKSSRWLGLLSIYNRDSASTVNVNFSSILSAGNYRLRNTQNMAETWDFAYVSDPVAVPTNFTSGALTGVGGYTFAITFPVFGAFVIEAGDDPIYGDTTWGHKTGVLELNIRSFKDNWTGTGGVSGINDVEKIGLHIGEYMDSEVVETGIRTVRLKQNKYGMTGDDVKIEYRHGATEALCLAAEWNDYVAPFVSEGFVQAKLESTL